MLCTLLSGMPCQGGDTAVHTIQIVTPEWENQTNPDGSGLFFDIIKAVYEPVGITMEYRFVPWKRAQSMVNSNHADAMLCVWKEHAEQESQLLPVFPMFVEHTAAVFRNGAFPVWNPPSCLDAKSAVWLRGYDYHTFNYFHLIAFREYTEVDTYDKAWELLASGRCDVYIDALIDISIYIDEKTVDMTPYRLEILWGEKAYPAFSNTERSRSLIRIYDQRIQELFQSGELQSIYKRWGAVFSPEAWMGR